MILQCLSCHSCFPFLCYLGTKQSDPSLTHEQSRNVPVPRCNASRQAQERHKKNPSPKHFRCSDLIVNIGLVWEEEEQPGWGIRAVPNSGIEWKIEKGEK